MVDLKSFTATKFGVLVTSIVILGACSHKVIQPDADTQIPQAAFSAPTPEPESAVQPLPETKQANLWKKHKRKTRIAKAQKPKRKHSAVVAKHTKKKKKHNAAAIAQVRDNGSNSGPGIMPPPPPAPEAAQMTPPAPPAPPAMDVHAESAPQSWMMWLALAAAAALGYAGFRYYRTPKRSRRRLVFNN
jgi:hypothetical protein